MSKATHQALVLGLSVTALGCAGEQGSAERQPPPAAEEEVAESREPISVATYVSIKTGKTITAAEAKKLYFEATPKYVRLDGLQQKYFLHGDGSTVEAIYVWEDRPAAEALFDHEYRKYIAAKFGAPPEISYFQVPVSVEKSPPDGLLAEGEPTGGIPMRVAYVRLALEAPLEDQEVERAFEEAVPTYQQEDHLLRKMFFASGDRTVVGGASVWTDPGSPTEFYSGGWKAAVTEKYGVEPELTIRKLILIVDNEAGGKVWSAR